MGENKTRDSRGVEAALGEDIFWKRKQDWFPGTETALSGVPSMGEGTAAEGGTRCRLVRSMVWCMRGGETVSTALEKRGFTGSFLSLILRGRFRDSSPARAGSGLLICGERRGRGGLQGM